METGKNIEDMEDLTGKQLGAYQVIAPLGEGGMAVVYKAYQPSMERYVALKILPKHFAAEPEFVRRFKQEAKIIASLEHPNILPVYDYGEADGYTYIVMRYVEGKTLADLLQGRPLPLPQIGEIVTKVASALNYAHSRGVVHRDVKPSNVLIDQQDNLLLSDFGVAKMFLSSEKLTTSGAFIGTPTYASPEQCLGSNNLDGRSDVYSLGVVLYEMATGRPPFNAETPMAVVLKHINDPLPLPRQLNPTLPESVERVILKALAKQPENRYQTAGEMAEALVTIVVEADKESAAGIPFVPALPLTTIAKRHYIPAWGWVFGCLVIFGGLATLTGVAIWGLKSPKNIPKSPTYNTAKSATATQQLFSTTTPIITTKPISPPTETAEAANLRATQTAPALTSPPTATPAHITTFSPTPKILALAAGWDYTCALTATGSVKCWGDNVNGVLGDGTTTTRLTPVDVSGLSNSVITLAPGWVHTCALTTAGGVKCWGNNDWGQLGDGTETDSLTPVDVSGLSSGVTALAAGWYHTCALTTAGGVQCWGNNSLGQLGDGTMTDSYTPVGVSGLSSGVIAVTAGASHTCALTIAGNVKCWGNISGGLPGRFPLWGDYSSTPEDMNGLSGDIIALEAGYSHTCALTAAGGVKCWGDNVYGQLGDGTTTDSDMPVNVNGLSGVVISLAAGGTHTCALTAEGGVKCWGENSDGQLGDGTEMDSFTPMDVSGLSNGVAALTAGEYHTCALTNAGGVKCWGNNDWGQLGDGTETDSFSPVNVSWPSGGNVSGLSGGVIMTPTIAPSPIQGYGLPFIEPKDVVSNAEGLWVLFRSRLVKLEVVEGENRLRAVEQIDFPNIRSLDWDIARNQYWAVSAVCDLPYEEDCFEEIELINRDGTVTATFTVSQTFDSSPIHLAWDGEYLWLTSLYTPDGVNTNLYKLQASVGTNELKQIDSFGLSLQWGVENLHGLAWDGTALWILDGYSLIKLDSSAQQVCKITLPATLDINWWEYQGITWDGQFLWVVHAGTNTVYRVDPKMCN